MSAIGLNPTNSGSGFLRFNSLPPRLHILGDDPEFDEVTMQWWREEGFDVTFHSLPPSPAQERAFMDALRHLADDLELGEAYAIVAYGRAATLALQAHQKPQPRLCALIAYYPDEIPAPSTKYPPHLQIICHLAGDQLFSPSFKSYRYAGTTAGFAEHDLPEYDKVAANLSWSRNLACVRKGFKKEVDLEALREHHVAAQFVNRDTAAAMKYMVDEPYVNNVPTMTGGIGRKDLQRFYQGFFMPATLPSLDFRLISRTMGVDRVVDEMFISFRHTKEIHWMLPGVPPTDKQVEIVLVSIVTIRGGRLVHEHIYWDQASVLVQIGLLDPKLVPENMQSKGLKRLPVVGREGARKVLDEESAASNDLIPRWNNRKNLSRANSKPPSQNRTSPAQNGQQSPTGQEKQPLQNGNHPLINIGEARAESFVADEPQTPTPKSRGLPVQIEDAD